MRTIIATSAKKPKNNRSIFLSALMKQLGGDTGEQLATAFVGTDVEAFKTKMAEIVDTLASKMPNAGK